jgi:hypothetical protein
METIDQAKQYLRDNCKKGVECPCCHQYVKLYKRPMHTAMAVSLIKLYRLSRERIEYHHINEYVDLSAGDFSKLRYWGLVEEKQKDADDSTKRTSGYWKITDAGIQFVLEQAKVQSHILLFNSKFLGFAGDMVSIKDVLKNKFNYQDLMYGV